MYGHVGSKTHNNNRPRLSGQRIFEERPPRRERVFHGGKANVTPASRCGLSSKII